MAGRWATVQARTTLLASAITGLTLVAGSVLLVVALQSQLTSTGDELAQARIRDLLATVAAGDLPQTLGNVHDDAVAQVLDEGGEVLAASSNIAGGEAITEVEPGDRMRVLTIDAPDDDETERYRVWVGHGPSASGGDVTVLVGSSLESVTEATLTLRKSLLVGGPVVLLLLAATMWLFVGRALRNIDRITAAVDDIGESELHRRVPVPGVDDEVGRLARTMNSMLDRLDAASRRQRAFVADASHDLQSPLAAIRSQLEVALAHPDRVELPELGSALLTTSAQMEQLVQDLLYVATSDVECQSPTHALLDLDDIVLEEAARVLTAAGVEVDTTEVSGAPVVGNSAELRRLVRNLLDNAVRHATTSVRVTLSSQPSGTRLVVTDDGPGVAAKDRDRVFDRFFQGDPARSRRGSSGLGLAIASDVARRHDGTLRLLPGAEGAAFELWLPPPDPKLRTTPG